MSQEAHSLFGNHVPLNMERTTDTSLHAFAEFYVHHERVLKHPGQKFGFTKEEILAWERRKKKQTLSLTRLYLFRNIDGKLFSSNASLWKDDQLKHVNKALIEFIAHRINIATGAELSTLTLRS